MFSACKYVVMKTIDSEVMYMFSSRVVHKTVSNKMEGIPVSAGFVGRSGGELACFGKSESLRLRSRPEDNTILMELLDL